MTIRLTILMLALLLATPALALTPAQCWEETSCVEELSAPIPAQSALFESYLDIEPQPSTHCGNKFFINYDPTVVAFALADTTTPTGQDSLTFELGPPFAGGDCATCTESLTLSWFDLFNDGTPLPTGSDAELVVTWQYLSATDEIVHLDGIEADGFEWAPGCAFDVTEPLNDLFVVPEPSLAGMLLPGVLLLVGAGRRKRLR